MERMLETQSGVLQEMFTSIIEDADANILLLGEDFRVVTVNHGFYWIFLENYGIDLKPGNSIIEAMEFANPKLAQVWRERCLMAANGNPFRIEETFELDGRTFHWEIYYKGIKQNEKRMISVFSRDITIRKAYQKRILENEANLRSILNTIDHSIWLVNSEFELIDFNKEFFKRYKQAYGIRLAKGENIIDLVPENLPQLRTLWRHRYEEGLKGKPGKYYDSYPIEGEIHTFEIKTYPIIEDGKVTGLTIYSRDITQQKKTEDLLKEQNEELTKINSELDRFVYSASHDLRAPLMSVKGLLNMIKIDPDPANGQNYLQLIERSVEKLDNFISDIIHYSRNSRMDLLVKEINFHELVKESIDSLKYMEGAEAVRSIQNIKVIAPFYSDYSRLLIVFNNIIANAVRYRDTWKNDSYLAISIDANETRARIVFSDNGIGIAAEYLNNIFKMFFRATADSKGSGLGLYIVKSAVEKLKGTIDTSSQLGEGTSFVLEIPNLKGYVS
jgi:PAS domain S-box-containing protein